MLKSYIVNAVESLFARRARTGDILDEAALAARPALVTLVQDLLALDGGLGLFRLVHLLDAARHAPAPRTIVSVGCGGGHHEAFLGWLYPEAQVVGIDLREGWAQPRPSNVRFLPGNLLDPAFRAGVPKADFVFTIEVLEHIEEQQEAAKAIASLVSPGGFLYVEVPFANDAEQADAALCVQERENHGHVKPGYAPSQLRELFCGDGLSEVSAGNAFFTPLQPIVWLGAQHFGPESLRPYWREILAWARADLKSRLAASRAEASAVKLLARRS
jgi:SAM-dependent methyltransferase